MRSRPGSVVWVLGYALPSVLALVGCSRVVTVGSGPVSAASTASAASAIDAIAEGDIRRDLFALAGDAFRGREAGTLDELRASGWLAERAREAGLEPAGEDGTFFQWWPMRRVRLAAGSRVAVGGQPLALWREIAVTTTTDAALDVPLVFVGQGTDAELAGVDLHGKGAVALIVPPPNPPNPAVSLAAWRYARAAVARQGRALAQRGAAAVMLVADSTAERAIGFFAAGAERGTYGLDTTDARSRPRTQVPVLLASRGLLDRLRAPGARLALALSTESFVYPSVNIVGRVRGTDAQLRDEYVVFGAHQDHDGVRFPVDGDSIWNGADDNASTSVALLAIGRAFARSPARRSALFVWHGAEERGLLGSYWFVGHPTVPKASMVAVLNGDMIGRNNADTAALLGSQPPHRNSAELVGMALAANARVGQFVIDSTWDRPSHPEGWYFRSDHLPYARAGIPALFFSTLLHPDYHTPRDEPARIDVPKLTRVARWMYATGWAVANTPDRPRLDPGFKLER